MGRQVKKSRSEIPTIDCSLITIETPEGEFGFDTSNKLQPEPQIDEQDAVKLVVKGRLIAQKPPVSTITGHTLTLTDNVFNPELVLILQGGRIIYDTTGVDEKIVGYEPPVAGSPEKGQVFTLNAYSAQYDASGQIVNYEKISYPNCKGSPVAFGSEDGTFRVSEYKVTSAPKSGQAPYAISYVNSLPALVDEYQLNTLTVSSVAGVAVGTTFISVQPDKDEYTNKYYYKTDTVEITLPLYGNTVMAGDGYTLWDGKEITAATGKKIAIVETNANDKAIAGGVATVVAKT